MLLLIFCITTILNTCCDAIEVVGRSTIRPKTDDEYDQDRAMFYPELDFEQCAVVPDFIPKAPEKRCRVIWDLCEAKQGNVVDQKLITEAPTVVWGGEHGALYTMILFHTHQWLKIHENWLPWVVGNIPGPNLYRLGDRLWPYNADYIKENGFIHKHILVIYKQKEFIHFAREDRYKPERCAFSNFNLTRFVEKYDLGLPKFGNFLFSNNYDWDNPEKRYFNAYLDKRDSHGVPTLYGINPEKF